MSKRSVLFAAWCLLMTASSAVSSYYAWSPFADGKRDNQAAHYGPTHK
ncbi:hypothetical protein KRR38_17750 [Novosphingobium sp. G106]|nr:hypothetical protein [Novosphingobium sp. G106]MBV1689469.1 hypothetical protein [Novosphingobium sp. G106]